MALDPKSSILTMNDVRVFLGKGDTDTADDQRLDMLAQFASSILARELGVASIVSSSYKEYRDGHGPLAPAAFGYGLVANVNNQPTHSGCNLWLDNYPVTSIDFVSVGRDDAMTVEYTAADASYATIEVTDTQVKLRKRVNGVLTTSSLDLASYATLTLLEAAIEAVTGWTVVTDSNFANYSPTTLTPMGARNARDQEITLQVPDEGEVEYELYGDWGRLYNPRGWPTGHRNVYVEYTAGYARGSVPPALRSAALDLTAAMYYVSKRDPTLNSETIGDYSYSAGQMEKLFNVAGGPTVLGMKIAPFRREVIG